MDYTELIAIMPAIMVVWLYGWTDSLNITLAFRLSYNNNNIIIIMIIKVNRWRRIWVAENTIKKLQHKKTYFEHAVM